MTPPLLVDTAKIRPFPKLARNLSVDVVVIGAGITGITAAYLLKKAGATVALVERERCARRDTGHTTAHLTYVSDQRIKDLVDDFGRDHAQALWEAGRMALGQIRDHVRDENIKCEFRWVPAYLHAAHGNKNPKKEIPQLQRDASLANELGFDAVFLERVPYVQRPGIRFANQAKFHPRRYLAGLLRTIDGGGCHVFENTAVSEIQDKPQRVVTTRGKIDCNFVFLATNTPLQGKLNTLSAMLFQSKLALYSSYVVGGRVPPRVGAGSFLLGHLRPLLLLRIDPQKDHDYAIFGGLDHKTGQMADTRKRYQRLDQSFRAIVPEVKIDHHWSGQIIETADGLPFIGEIAPRQFVATGYCGNGMTFATIAALMARDAFSGRKNPWRDLFDPHRKKVTVSAWNYLKENKDYIYYLVRDRVARAEGKSSRSVKAGEGKILKLKQGKVAVYRDPAGKLSIRSAYCTHMGCIVDWNEAEKNLGLSMPRVALQSHWQGNGRPAESDLSESESGK